MFSQFHSTTRSPNLGTTVAQFIPHHCVSVSCVQGVFRSLVICSFILGDSLLAPFWRVYSVYMLKKSVNTGEQVFRRPVDGINKHFLRNGSSHDFHRKFKVHIMSLGTQHSSQSSYIPSVTFRHFDGSGGVEPLSPVDRRHGKSSDKLYIFVIEA